MSELETSPVQGVAEHSPCVHSMTGFGSATVRPEGLPALTLTLRSINHRFLDVQLRMPPSAEPLEGEMRSRLKAALVRGHVDCTLTIERVNPKEEGRRQVATEFDKVALRRYLDSFRAVAAEFGLACEPNLNVAAQLPGMLCAAAEATPQADMDATLRTVLPSLLPGLLRDALAALQTMRAREGAALAAILRECLGRLEALVEEVASLRAAVQAAHYERLAERMKALVGTSFDRDRVLMEAALVAERGDVEEEAARLRTHIGHFHGLLDDGGEVGKKLDFLLQEMNREANTLLSKTAGVAGDGMRITELGLAMKSDIEKAREQVQNIE